MENLNSRLSELDVDYLYHLGLDSSMDLQSMFGDVKYVCMGGSAERAEVLAKKAAKQFNVPIPEGEIQPIGKTERFSLYKIGPIISVSHGMGMPSVSILLHEITKLMHYAGVKDPVFLRVGTSGGIGVEPGTVVVTTEGLNGKLKPNFEHEVLGKIVRFPTKLDPVLAQEIMDVRGDIAAVLGKTVGTQDFYEGQARQDGALETGYTDEEKIDFLQRAHVAGARNIEMEATQFAAFTTRAGIRAADICVTLLDRLQGDQVTATPAQLGEYSDRAQQLALNYIQSDMAKRLINAILPPKRTSKKTSKKASKKK